MKIWLDDIRQPPDNSWTWAKNAYLCAGLLLVNDWDVTEISFDHDLGYFQDENVLDVNNTGYVIAKLIERLAHEGLQKRLSWQIHSANPVGRRNIELAMKSAEKFWDSQENRNG